MVDTGDAVDEVTMAWHVMCPEAFPDAVTGMETDCSAPLGSLPIVITIWPSCSVIFVSFEPVNERPADSVRCTWVPFNEYCEPFFT